MERQTSFKLWFRPKICETDLKPLNISFPALLGEAIIRKLAESLSALLHERFSALADFLQRNFQFAKFLRTQFREHSFHLPGMLSEG